MKPELGLFQNKNIDNIRNSIISNIIKSNDNLLQEHPILSKLILNNNDTLNLLCFMVGESNYIEFVPIFWWLFGGSLLSVPEYYFFLSIFIFLLLFHAIVKPFSLLGSGWLEGVNLYSIGMLGFKHIMDNGTLFVHGFTGIKLYTNDHVLGGGHFIGSAISIDKTDPP